MRWRLKVADLHRAWQVVGIDEDNARVMVSLAVGSSTTTVSQYAIKLVTKSEFDKFSKYLSELTTSFLCTNWAHSVGP